MTFVFLSFELFLFIFQSVVFSRDIIIARVGFLFKARVSFVEEVLGTNLLKSRLFILAASYIGTRPYFFVLDQTKLRAVNRHLEYTSGS